MVNWNIYDEGISIIVSDMSCDLCTLLCDVNNKIDADLTYVLSKMKNKKRHTVEQFQNQISKSRTLIHQYKIPYFPGLLVISYCSTWDCTSIQISYCIVTSIKCDFSENYNLVMFTSNCFQKYLITWQSLKCNKDINSNIFWRETEVNSGLNIRKHTIFKDNWNLIGRLNKSWYFTALIWNHSLMTVYWHEYDKSSSLYSM